MASRCIVRQAKVSIVPADKLSASLRVKNRPDALSSV